MKPPVTKRDYDRLARKQWRAMTVPEFQAEIRAARELKATGQSRCYVFSVTGFLHRIAAAIR
jgi:hypothetical protein